KLAVPSSAARMGMVLRYFQKQGVPGPTALSISAIETFTGFLVQLALLGAVLSLGSVEMSLPDEQQSPSGDLLSLLAALLVVAVVAGVIAAAVPSVRHRLTDRFRPWLGDAHSALDTLRSPLRLVQLVGGNVATQLLYALALAACVVAFGAEIDLGAALAVYVIAALFGGFMPVPGGIGVMEAAITVGLVAVGVGESAALAAAITFRIVTFYIPPLWGWVSFRWLERNRYL
ncbi:MAG: YbhN family protein, partial [Microthrixaceae bacterium]